MRRWLFATLVLANLGLLLWGAQFVEQDRQLPPQEQPPVNPEKLRLLKEVQPNKLVARPKPAAPTPPVVPIPDGPVICYRMGPFTEESAAEKVEAALARAPASFTRTTEASDAVTGYRVFLPPFKTKELAERKRRELGKLGIRDHALMQDDGFENAISLGLFSVEANAQSRIRQLALKGVHAKVQSVQQTQTRYWLQLDPVSSAAETRTQLGALLEGIKGAALHETPCPPAATAPAEAPRPVGTEGEPGAPPPGAI